MGRYLIELPHKPEECLQIMDDVQTQSPQMLAEYEWGCAGGRHSAWVTVEAENNWSAGQMVPSSWRARLRCIAVKKFSPEQIKAFQERGL